MHFNGVYRLTKGGCSFSSNQTPFYTSISRFCFPISRSSSLLMYILVGVAPDGLLREHDHGAFFYTVCLSPWKFHRGDAQSFHHGDALFFHSSFSRTLKKGGQREPQTTTRTTAIRIQCISINNSNQHFKHNRIPWKHLSSLSCVSSYLGRRRVVR